MVTKLVGISPAGFVTFLSDCYGDWASDKYIKKDKGFYDWEDMIITDRGFQIHGDLLLRFWSWHVPPGATAKSPLTTNKHKKGQSQSQDSS